MKERLKKKREKYRMKEITYEREIKEGEISYERDTKLTIGFKRFSLFKFPI